MAHLYRKTPARCLLTCHQWYNESLRFTDQSKCFFNTDAIFTISRMPASLSFCIRLHLACFFLSINISYMPVCSNSSSLFLCASICPLSVSITLNIHHLPTTISNSDNTVNAHACRQWQQNHTDNYPIVHISRQRTV